MSELCSRSRGANFNRLLSYILVSPNQSSFGSFGLILNRESFGPRPANKHSMY